jgi:hypothetical protein
MDELTHLGLTDFELFLFDYSAISYRATVETVNHLLGREGKLDKSKWNTHLQKAYGISKRHAGGIIAHSEGKVSSAKECRSRHIKQLESQLKSARQWVSKAEKRIKLARKFYVNKNWQKSKNGCNFPLAISLESQKTNWHQLKFNIHHKQRYIHKIAQQIKCLKAALRERGKKYARMLSQWAYSRFYHLLESILSNRGISLFKRNPAYTSLIGLVKYARMYGLSSDIAAAIAIARRGMNLSERLPCSMSAYLGVNPRKHVWNALHQLNKFIGRCVIVNRRHDYYSVSNWESVVKLNVE